MAMTVSIGFRFPSRPLPPNMISFLIRFAQAWGPFRTDELDSVSQIEGIELEYDAEEYRENVRLFRTESG